jgi:hypothetical protein
MTDAWYRLSTRADRLQPWSVLKDVPRTREKKAVREILFGRTVPTRYDTRRRREGFSLRWEGTITERIWDRCLPLLWEFALQMASVVISVANRVVEASSTEGGMVRSPVFFHQHCPVCGRVVRVRVSLLGRQVYCQHCQGSFVATDPSMADGQPVASVPLVDDLIERANDLLARARSSVDAEESAAAIATPASTAFR